MKCIERTRCAVAGTADLETLYTFKDFPVQMGCTAQPRSDDTTADMAWAISRGSGLVQLRYLIPLDVLYRERHDSSASSHWLRHHREFALLLRRYGVRSVLEIGGSYGILSVEYGKLDGGAAWTIVEPNPAPVAGCRARFIRGFFEAGTVGPGEYDAFVHTNLLEHLYEPNDFMRTVAGSLPEGRYHIFSHPNMQLMLERDYLNCINFEHTMLLTEPYVEYLLAKNGFRLVHKEYFMDEHTIFYATVRDSSVARTPLPPGLYDANRKLFFSYINRNLAFASEVNARLRSASSPVYMFGAHVFAQYLMAFGIDPAGISGIIDNDRSKHGKRLYGTPLNVYPCSVLRETAQPVVILKAGVHTGAVRDDIRKNINPDTVFWE